MSLRRLILGAVLALAPIATAASADVARFRVVLAGVTLGDMHYETDPADGGRPSGLSTNLDNTPLGVLNGGWRATSQPILLETGDAAIRFEAVTASTRKDRVIAIVHAGGRALATAVDPAEDMTDLSLPNNVPTGVLDPVQAFGQLAAAQGCPGTFRLYDGRRVVQIAPTGSEEAAGSLTCHLDYRVVAGPGHLSPFRFRNFDLDLVYIRTEAGQVLSEAQVSAGPFTVRLAR